MSEEIELNNIAKEIVEKTTGGIENVVPSMNVNLPEMVHEETNLITDQHLLGIYNEIIENLRQDREEINDFLSNFANQVMNEGDATTSSKEALVNLVKIKSDTADKMAKIADLMTRVKLKEKDTFPRYLAANQNNTINIGEGTNKRELLKQIERFKKEKK